MKIIEHFNVGKAKYLVSWNDGTRFYKDGSPFYDCRIFKNKIKKQQFINQLK